MWDDEEALSELIHAFKVEARQRVRDDRARAPEDVAGLLDVIERRLFDPRFDVSASARCAASAGRAGPPSGASGPRSASIPRPT